MSVLGCLNVIHKNLEYLTNEVTWLSLDIGFSITLVQILPAISLCRLAHTDTALANGKRFANCRTHHVQHKTLAFLALIDCNLVSFRAIGHNFLFFDSLLVIRDMHVTM